MYARRRAPRCSRRRSASSARCVPPHPRRSQPAGRPHPPPFTRRPPLVLESDPTRRIRDPSDRRRRPSVRARAGGSPRHRSTAVARWIDGRTRRWSRRRPFVPAIERALALRSGSSQPPRHHATKHARDRPRVRRTRHAASRSASSLVDPPPCARSSLALTTRALTSTARTSPVCALPHPTAAAPPGHAAAAEALPRHQGRARARVAAAGLPLQEAGGWWSCVLVSRAGPVGGDTVRSVGRQWVVSLKHV